MVYIGRGTSDVAERRSFEITAPPGCVIHIQASAGRNRWIVCVHSIIIGELYGISATDALTFSAVTLILLAIALLSCYIPARPAIWLDPVVALRYD